MTVPFLHITNKVKRAFGEKLQELVGPLVWYNKKDAKVFVLGHRNRAKILGNHLSTTKKLG